MIILWQARQGPHMRYCLRAPECDATPLHNNSCIWCGWFIACGYVVVLLWFDCIPIQLSHNDIIHVSYLCFSYLSSRWDTSGACPTSGGRCTWGCTSRWYPEHVKHVKNTQFKIGSWQVADFEGLYFVGQVCRGELNGSVLDNYIYIRLRAV